MKFKPCNGDCTFEGTHCEGCGRTHKEIGEMRKIVGDAIVFIDKMGYENIEDVANGFAKSIKYKMGLDQ